MKRSIVFVVFVIMTSLFLAGCSAKETAITEDMNGQQVSIKPGDILVVQLPGNITTGFTWEADGLDQAILEQQGEAEYKADSEALGAPGMITLKFKAVSAGDTSLKLIYHRTFEKGVAPEKTFEISVNVK